MDKLDSRVSDVKKRGLVETPWGGASRIYCVNCYRPGGIITDEAYGLIIWLCDDCFFTKGSIPGLEEVEENTIKQFLKNDEIQFAKEK